MALLVSTTIGTSLIPLPDQALAQTTVQKTFSIPAGPLSQALAAFGRQAGLQVTYRPQMTSGKTSPGMIGSASPGQALARILQGSDLSYDFINSSTVAITKAGSASAGINVPGMVPLETINVEGANPATTEGTNSYGSGYATIAGKVPTALKETPQSVSVVTQKRIQDQNFTTLDQAIAQTTGMVVQQGDSDRPYYYTRGFQIDTYMIDGTPVNISNATSTQNLAMFDRVEVLRGPSGLLSGLGSPAGTINLVRKLPTSTFQISDELLGGSYLNFRNVFDVSGPLNANGTLRGRFVSSAQTQDFIETSAYRRDAQFYGVLEADLSQGTTVRGGFSYQTVPQRAAWTGVPVNTNYDFIQAPRSTFFGPEWNDNVYQETTLFGQIEHHFNNGWIAKSSINYIEDDSSVISQAIDGQANASTNIGSVDADKWRFTDQQEILDTYASGPFSLFDRTHTATLGFTASHERLNQWNYYCSADNIFCTANSSIFSLNTNEPAFDGPANNDITETYQYGLYGSFRFKLADPLTLILGGRLLWWNNAYDPNPNANFFGDAHTHDYINAKPIPYAGLIYDINRAYSAYVSYTDMFQPQTVRDVNQQLLPPIEGSQFEAGIKGSYFADRLNASLAAFQIIQQNRAEADPNDPTGTIFFAQGKARSRGIEAELSGKITEDWNIFAGYTYTRTKNFDDSYNTDNGAAFTSIAPVHLFKLWTTYRLPRQFNRWTIGGGVIASSKFYDTDSGGTLVAPGYAVLSTMLSYQINDHFIASLNVDNLLDTTYIRSINGTVNGFYGDPRTILFKVRATW